MDSVSPGPAVPVQTIKVHAFFLGERINIRPLEKGELLAKLPLMLSTSSGGSVVIFRYGVVVFFNVEQEEEGSVLNRVMTLLSNPFSRPSTEETVIRIDPAAREEVLEEGISLGDAGVPRLQLIAEILAKSLVLDHYEHHVARSMVRLEPLLANLQKKGFRGVRTRHLLEQITDSLLSLHRMAGIVEVSDKPELLWEYPELERLYARMEDEYEIRDRHRTLERKVELIFRTADTLQDLLHTKRALRVEWYIVILIVIEIVITIYEMIFLRR